jgi:ATP-dependent protease ClpP protease subunit
MKTKIESFKGLLPGLSDEDGQFDKENMVSYGKQVKNIFHLWLIDEIGDARCFLKWFDILQSAGEDDLVVIHINCFGGDLFTAIQIVTQIKLCQAQVVCQIESACASAATMVALACDGLICYPHGYMMIHTSSGCSFGKQSDIKKEEEFYNPWLENFFNEIYKHFLTKKEIQEVLDGKDIWLHADEVVERFRKKVDIINRETNKAKREQMKKLQSFMSNLQNKDSTGAVEIGMDDKEKTEKSEKAEKKPAKKGKARKSKTRKSEVK